MITKKCLYGVLAGHTIFVLVEAVANAVSVESWNLFFSFLVDLPISMLFHSVLENYLYEDRHWALLVMHVVLGGIWWAGILCGVMKLISAIRSHRQNYSDKGSPISRP